MTAGHLIETGSGPIPNTRLGQKGYSLQSHHTAWMKTLMIVKFVTPVHFITL